MNVPKEYQVGGLGAKHYSKPNSITEAVGYITPNGTEFTLAKDFMGIQFCKSGRFWPPPFTSFASMTEAVYMLRNNTKDAVDFFDKVNKIIEEKRHEEKT